MTVLKNAQSFTTAREQEALLPTLLLLSAECDPPTTSHRWPAAKLMSLLVT